MDAQVNGCNAIRHRLVARSAVLIIIHLLFETNHPIACCVKTANVTVRFITVLLFWLTQPGNKVHIVVKDTPLT